MDALNPSLSRPNKNFPQRLFRDGISDFHVLPSLSIGRRGHAQLRVAAFIDAARRAITGFVKRLGDSFSFSQHFLEASQPQRCRQIGRPQPPPLPHPPPPSPPPPLPPRRPT